MKDIDNIEDWYRDELNNYNVEPDKHVWDDLADDLDADTPLTDENISEWYRKEVTKLEERPDYTVWEKLSTKLDTATVWDKLVVSLNRYDQYIWWRNVAFRGTAVFLLLMGSYLAYNNYTSDKNNSEEIASTNHISSKKTNNSNTAGTPKNDAKPPLNSTNNNDKKVVNNNTKQDVTADINPNANTLSVKTKEQNIREALNKAKSNLANKSDYHKDDHNVYASRSDEIHINTLDLENLDPLKIERERSIFTEINRHRLSEKDISHLYSKGEFLVKKDKNKIVFNSKRFSSYFVFGLYARRFYVGANIGIKKQGMITKFKKNSALADYNQTNFLDYGNNFGATVGFIVSDKFNLESNINISSTSGYKRAYNAEGISYTENLNLNYSSVSLLAKKMNTKSTFDNKVYSTNLIGGIYASYLRSASSDINGVSKKLDNFNNTDLGIVLGIEQDRYITKTLVVTPCIRYNQGITNIVSENNPFESSRNFSFEFNLGVKYIFLKKSK